MTQTLTISISALALALTAGTGLAQPHPFSAKDLATLERVSDPQLSPDGKQVLYTLRTVDYAANKAAMSLWLVDTSGKGAPHRLAISEGGASHGRWSPDGKAIYFISNRAGGIDEVFRTDVAGAAAVQVTSAPFDVGAFKLTRDGKTLVFSQAVFPECETLACSKQKSDEKKQLKSTGVVYERLYIRHWDTWDDGTKNHLFAVKLDGRGVATGEPLDLMKGFDGDCPTKPFGDDDDFTLSPDGKRLVFSAKVAGHDEAWNTNYDLWSVALDGAGKPEDLTATNKAWDAGPVFSPDGKWLAYRAMKRPGFEADRFAIILRDLASGAEHELAPAWDRSASAITWSHDGKAILVQAEDVGQTKLFAIDATSAKVTALTGPGHMSAFDPGPSGIVYAHDTLTGPAQLHFLRSGSSSATRLTNHNAEQLKNIAFGQYEQFSFKGWNDETVHGFVVKPANFEPGKKYPVAFLIHGGPQGSFSNLFHYRWNAETYAGAGYAAVMIDFHGSTGYGQAFTDAISQHWGDRPLEDLKKGWAYALAKYPFLDGGHACALGGSYGGFMVNWIASQWKEPWKCLVMHDGIFDSRTMGYSTEELWFSEWENGDVPWKAGTTYARFNPADHVAEWSVPEMVVQGGLDFRVPLEQGIATFTALQRKGVPSKMLYFPNENHWVLKPQNSVQWHDEVLKWLNRWTKGEKESASAAGQSGASPVSKRSSN